MYRNLSVVVIPVKLDTICNAYHPKLDLNHEYFDDPLNSDGHSYRDEDNNACPVSDNPDDWLNDVTPDTKSKLTDTQGELVIAGTGFYNRMWLNISTESGNLDNELNGNIRYYIMHKIMKRQIGN